MSRRPEDPDRRRGGSLLVTLLLLVLLIGAVFTVVMVLDALERPRPVGTGCRVDDGERTYRLTAEQTGNAALIVAVGAARELPERALTIAVATAMQESSLRNLDHGDRDSLGLFQQRPSQGWGSPAQVQDPVYAAGIFYDRLLEVPGYLDKPLTESAQAVQRSAFPDLYAQHEPLAAALTGALTGEAPAALWCHLPALEQTDPDGPAEAGGGPAGPAPAAAARFGDLLERDQPGARLASALGGELRVEAGSAREAWALAQWAVATAADSRIARVEVASSVWHRSGAGWEPAEDSGQPDGTVVVR